MSLPMPWVEKIFTKLVLTFGREFTARWDEASLLDVKNDWAHELRGFAQNPQALAFGLEHCVSGKPPTVHEFKAACQRRPDPLPAALLDVPLADPQRVAAELARCGSLRQVAPFRDHKAWAKKLVERHAQGLKVSTYALKAAQSVAGAGAAQ